MGFLWSSFHYYNKHACTPTQTHWHLRPIFVEFCEKISTMLATLKGFLIEHKAMLSVFPNTTNYLSKIWTLNFITSLAPKKKTKLNNFFLCCLVAISILTRYILVSNCLRMTFISRYEAYNIILLAEILAHWKLNHGLSLLFMVYICSLFNWPQ